MTDGRADDTIFSVAFKGPSRASHALSSLPRPPRARVMASCSSSSSPVLHAAAGGLGLGPGRGGSHPFSVEIAVILFLGALVATTEGQAQAVTAFTVGHSPR